ncbi:histone acetyltransferase-like protein [Chrysochromulina tobinii]|uniref:tRNA carboxymethyluridine synthase n=1 Tax=Chrysochromulina tobinii TaxID=1460289 RepID=A0A0M0J979_9EUKA|nr:histone acetyltransferase-like protein [Chrysochromulina tobinii]|eukprot:KOO22907.1 histone acetyltransferase-like protein [Chrysochromulina sp. CCMP291]
MTRRRPGPWEVPMENPDKYKNTRYYASNSDLEDIYRAWDSVVAEEELPALEKVVRALAADVPPDARAFERDLLQHRKEHKITFRKASLLHVYHRLVGLGEIEPSEQLSSLLVKKSSKSQSGVLVITVLTSPYPTVDGKTQRFSCAWNCYYCPNEPGQPRSYLHDEPAVKRANENGFDPVLQFTDRAATLAMNGHPVDKIELLVLGGTWASYPHAYQEAFVRDLFFAANTFWQRTKRPRLSLLEEQTINETARVKIIGLTLETRPDTIDAAELRRLRRYGCTRVQLGVQHIDDRLLRKINRGHGVAHVAVALARLKDACFKVDVHLMPQLPSATLEDDRQMFARVLSDPSLQADQWKIYPTQVVPWTIIKKWHEAGEYEPYATDALVGLLMEVKSRVHPWIRLNRVVRDIPIQYVSGGLDVPNLREDVLSEMARRGMRCRCIRCREIGGEAVPHGKERLVARTYLAAGAAEHFLSFETADDKLIGFLRLRLPTTRRRRARAANLATYLTAESYDPPKPRVVALADADAEALGVAGVVVGATGVVVGEEEEHQPFVELRGAALIREVHVYGQLIATEDKGAHASQHVGLGTRLMAEAERRARAHGFLRVAVIAGVGSRGFYRKLGYHLDERDGKFMLKQLGWLAPGLARARGAHAREDACTRGAARGDLAHLARRAQLPASREGVLPLGGPARVKARVKTRV